MAEQIYTFAINDVVAGPPLPHAACTNKPNCVGCRNDLMSECNERNETPIRAFVPDYSRSPQINCTSGVAAAVNQFSVLNVPRFIRNALHETENL